MTNQTIEDRDGVLWGIDKIAQVINRNPRQTHWLLSSGQIKCAMKKGFHWVAPRAALRREFGLGPEANPFPDQQEE